VQENIVDLKSVFSSLAGSNVLVLPDTPLFTIIAVSDDYLQDTGRVREELLGKGLFEMFPNNPNDPNQTSEKLVRASLEYALKHKETHYLAQQQYDIPKADNTFEERFWKANNKPVLNENGEVIYLIHSAQDITEQIRAEQKAVQFKSIEKAFELFMQAPEVISLLKGDNYIVELANHEALKLWGKGDNIIGRPLLEVIPEIKGQGIIEILDQVRATGKTYMAKEEAVTSFADGKQITYYFNRTYQPYFDEGSTEATGVLTLSHNVTEQVEARQKIQEITERLNFRNALFEAQNEATDDGVLIVDDKGKVLLQNKQFETIWNLPKEVIDSGEDVLVQNHAITQVADPKAYTERLHHLRNNKKEKGYDEILFKDGRVIERTGTPIMAENGLYYGWAWYFRDITDRIKQQQKFKNVVEQANDPILILKGEEMVLEVANEALLQIWKVDKTAIGKTFLEILPEMRNQGFLELLQQVYHTGKPFQGTEVPAVFEAGNGLKRTVYFNFTYQPYKEIDGTITGVLVLATDVTGQVMANQKLVESERNLRNTILQSPVAMCILKGPQFIVEVANERMFELWGKTTKEVIGRPMFEGLPEMKDQGFATILHKVYTTGETFVADEQLIQLIRNGSIEPLYANFVYQPYREGDGTISGIIVVANEVTAQVEARKRIEESEQELQLRVKERTAALENQRNLLDSILQNSSNGISVSKVFRDEKGKVVDALTIMANDSAIKYIGLPPEIYFTKRATEIEPGIIDSPYYQQCIKTLDTGEAFFMQYQMEANGKWLELTVSRLDHDHLIQIFTDITTIKEAQLQLERTVLELRRSNAYLGDFAHAASHDMKEPLRKIRTFTDRLKMTMGPRMEANETALFERIELSAERMQLLVDDLLEFSHVSEQPKELEEIDLNKKVQAVLTDLELLIEEKNANVIVKALPTIKGNRRQLQQLFQNLISNALKYSKPDVTPAVIITSQTITAADAPIDLPAEQDTKRFHLLQVKDNGIGFEQEYANKIFEMFQRLHGKAEYSGTGVGLSIVRKVVENHQGYIWAEGQPGEGASFYILLPA
jgi:PAS domain S-box-containing protein